MWLIQPSTQASKQLLPAAAHDDHKIWSGPHPLSTSPAFSHRNAQVADEGRDMKDIDSEA
jgi:hypothetical protein